MRDTALYFIAVSVLAIAWKIADIARDLHNIATHLTNQ